jgi:hypothetical protein
VKPRKYAFVNGYVKDTGGGSIRLQGLGMNASGGFLEWRASQTLATPPRTQTVLRMLEFEEADMLYQIQTYLTPLPAASFEALQPSLAPTLPADAKVLSLLASPTGLAELTDALATPQVQSIPVKNYAASLYTPALGGTEAVLVAPRATGGGYFYKKLNRSWPAQTRPWFQRVVLQEPTLRHEVLVTVTPVSAAEMPTATTPAPTTADELMLTSILTTQVGTLNPSGSESLAKRYFRVTRRELDSNGNGIWDSYEWANGFHAFATSGPRHMQANALRSDGMTHLAAFQGGVSPAGPNWSAAAGLSNSPFICLRQIWSDGHSNYLSAPQGVAPAWPNNRAYRSIAVEQRRDWTVIRPASTGAASINYREGYGLRFQWDMADDMLYPIEAYPPGTPPYHFGVRYYSGRQPVAIPFPSGSAASGGGAGLVLKARKVGVTRTTTAEYTPGVVALTLDDREVWINASLLKPTSVDLSGTFKWTYTAPPSTSEANSTRTVYLDQGFQPTVGQPSASAGDQVSSTASSTKWLDPWGPWDYASGPCNSSNTVYGDKRLTSQDYLRAVTSGDYGTGHPLSPNWTPTSETSASLLTDDSAPGNHYKNELLQYKVKNPNPANASTFVWFELFTPDTDKNGMVNSADGPPTVTSMRYDFKAGEAESGPFVVNLGKGKSSRDSGFFNLGAGGTSEGILSLLPMEVVDANKAAVSKLKVGKMSETGVLTGTGASATLDIDKDSDRFFIRVPGGASMGGISVKVSTTDNPDGAYNDNATQIDLVTDGADAISKSMLLVSDDVDDDHPVDGIADDATGDRTHKVQLGGNFKIEEIKIGTGAWQTFGNMTPVPARKMIKCDVFVLKVGGTAVRTNAQVEREMKIVQERFAQVAVSFDYAITEKEQPVGVSLSDGLDAISIGPGSLLVHPEAKSLIQGHGTVGSIKDVQVFYVNQINAAGLNPRGVALADFGIDEADEDYIFNVFVGSPHVFDPFNVAHELGHLLNDFGHEGPDTNLMMGNGTPTTNTIGASKRLNATQETRVLNSDRLSNP